MYIGTTIRNMGLQSTPQTILGCARTAEEHRIESIWITDHLAIPPDDAEGSGGRYLDTLTTLAWIGGATSNVKLGSGVLIVPYRTMLPTAKQIATVQELSNNRLLLGVGVGWMDSEFRALGVDRHQRGKITDETLAFINSAFADDVVSLNGQAFLFKPRPDKPPILVGGAPPHALQRAAEFGDGWLPMAKNPAHIADAVVEYRRLTDALGKPRGSITVMTTLPLDDRSACEVMLEAYRALEIDRVVCSISYNSVDEYAVQIGKLAHHID